MRLLKKLAVKAPLVPVAANNPAALCEARVKAKGPEAVLALFLQEQVRPAMDKFISSLNTDAHYEVGVPILRNFRLTLDPTYHRDELYFDGASLPVEVFSRNSSTELLINFGLESFSFGSYVDSLGNANGCYLFPVGAPASLINPSSGTILMNGVTAWPDDCSIEI